MYRPSSKSWKRAGALALIGTLAALFAGSALADPPNYPRHLVAQAQVGLAHEPEIVSGIASPATTAQPARVPEIVSGISSPAAQSNPTGSAPGFDWDNVAIGLGSGLGLLLLAGGTMFIVLRH